MFESELLQDLRHLGDMAEHVGQVANSHRATEVVGPGQTLFHVSDDRLTRHQELVHQDVPRPHGHATRFGQATQRIGCLRTNGEVVVDNGHLAIQQEVTVRRVMFQTGEQLVEQLHQSQAK